ATMGIVLTALLLLVPDWRHKLHLLLNRLRVRSLNYTPVRYLEQDMLTPVSKRRLTMVKRKTLVLDMDETLIQSQIIYHNRRKDDDALRSSKQQRPVSAGYDHCFSMSSSNATVYVYKRPHVDFFLDRVSQWYNIYVFTTATETYASRVLDYLDAGRNILNRRLYRQDCIDICGMRAKFVSMCHRDLANVLLLDDSHTENSFNVGNALRIKPYCRGTRDTELLCMLPVLDALRFTRDVRSILGRSTRYKCLA
ncbi:hypothetical protein KR222_003209, partial [Zaprionus bogoriensis]